MKLLRFTAAIALLALPARVLAQSSSGPVSTAASAASSAPPIDSAAGTDVLTLRDGTVLRGRVYEMRAGQFVNIVLFSGERRTIAASDLAGAIGPSFSTAPWTPAPSALPSMPFESSTFTQPVAGRVPLVVTSEGVPQSVFFVYGHAMVGMGRSRGTVLLTTPVCTTPCRLFVPPGEFPMVTRGPGIRETFTVVDVPTNGLSVQMHAPSLSAWVGVFTTATIGTAAIAASIPLWLLGGLGASSRIPSPGATNLLIAAGATTSVAVGLIVTAIVLGVTHPAGIARRGPVDAELAMFGVAPVNGGAVMTAGLRF